jgi:hypothetical protein
MKLAEQLLNLTEKENKEEEKKAKLRAQYKDLMQKRSDAFVKFNDVKQKKYGGSSDNFYNDDIVTYNKLRGEIDKYAAEADKIWDLYLKKYKVKL